MEKYSLGLDIGSNSVGWALVNENNDIVKKNGKRLWGVRMFDEASTALERRGYRSQRRKINRRKERLSLLNDLFTEEINKVDPHFFERLEDSFFKKEDKRNDNSYTLFNDTNYSDKDYFKEYPTIWHLRQALIKNDEKVDIRKLYLAIHHVIKFRGNFLYSGEEFNPSNIDSIKEFFNKINDLLIDYQNEYEDDANYFEKIDIEDENSFYEKLKEIMTSTSGIRFKKEALKNLFKVENKTFVNECLIKLLAGTNVVVNKLTFVKDLDYEKIEITYSSEEYEKLFLDASKNIFELNKLIEFLICGKNVVDYYFLLNLLKDKVYISDAMVDKYNNHKDELKELKEIIREYLPEEYDNVFRNTDIKENYPNYIGMNNTDKNMTRFSHCKREDFYKFITKILSNIKDEKILPKIEEIKLKMENSNYLLRQNSDQNGVFPKQLHFMELDKILNNQAKYYPFLLNKDESGLTVIEKIKSIFNFKIPYYVGPLNNNSPYSWVVKKSDNKIYPWNFENSIDVDETAKKFILRMQNKCTYLRGEDDYCLPKNSILFSEYNCLNYLNKLYINGSPISYEMKINIFDNLFKKVKSPTKKKLKEFIKANYGECKVTTRNADLEEINCNMNSLIIFNDIFNDQEYDLETIENIIKDVVIFEDKSILERRLVNLYKLPIDIVKKIKGLTFAGYSSLSKRFLNGLNVINPQTGEYYGKFIDVMRKTNLNLQEILYSPDYSYLTSIDEYNSKIKIDNDVDFKTFIDENLYVSPMMKRPLIQAYQIIEEVEKIIKSPIDKYYIECTRSNNNVKGNRGRKASRYENIKQIYSTCRKLALDYSIDINSLTKKLDENKDKLQSDKIYLYFTQLGKCMYTMENIDFEDLLDNYKYDIDHIYPQSLIKDDSMSNRVLTKKSKNNAKSDKFIFEIENFLSPKMYKFYDMLLEKGLITKEKYRRLTKKEISKEELDGFVNRQIVSTNQAVKGLVDLLKQYKNISDKDIIYSKAEVVSDFRRDYDLIKSRTANNYHHAHDAYLNVVVGRVINMYYNYHRFYNIKDYDNLKNKNITINPSKILEKDRFINNKPIWEKEKSIELIKKNMYSRFDIMETTSCYNSDQLFGKTTVLNAKEGNIPVTFKDARKDVTKYGGLKQQAFSKYSLISNVNKNGETDYIIEPIPAMYHFNTSEYLNNIGYGNSKIIIDNLKINTVLVNEKKKFCITGKTNDYYLIKNLNDRHFDFKSAKTIKRIDKYMDNLKNKLEMAINEDYIIVSPAKNDKCKEIVITDNEIESLYLNIVKMLEKEVYDFNQIQILKNSLPSNLEKLDIQEKVKVCFELLKILKTNERTTADLTLLGLSKNAGTIKISKKLEKGYKIVAESITGYYSKVLFEVK